MKKDLIEKKPKLTSAQKKLQQFCENQEFENILSNQSRARSVTVGTAFGGTTEVMMRGDGGRHLWCVMQPVEVIELIHQLASNVGCHIAIKPREDFSSWRDWKVTEAERLHMNGWAPFVNDMAPFNQLGANMEKYEALKKQKQIEQEEKVKHIEALLLKNSTQENDNEEKIKIYDDLLTQLFEIRCGKDNAFVDIHNNKTVDAEIKNDFLHIFGGKGGEGATSKITELMDSAYDKKIQVVNSLNQKKETNDDSLATKKDINKSSTKRSSTSS